MYLHYSTFTCSTNNPSVDGPCLITDKSVGELFPDAIPIVACTPSLENLFGVYVDANSLYDNLLLVMQKSAYLNDDSYLEEFGDPNQIRKAIGALYELEGKNEEVLG